MKFLLMELDHGILIINLLEMWFLLLTVAHEDILIFSKKNNLGLVQEPTDDIDDSVPVAEKSFILILTNQEQSLCLVYITMLMKVICMSIKQKFCIWKGLDDIPRVVLGQNCNLDDLFFLKSCFIKSSGNML